MLLLIKKWNIRILSVWILQICARSCNEHLRQLTSVSGTKFTTSSSRCAPSQRGCTSSGWTRGSTRRTCAARWACIIIVNAHFVHGTEAKSTEQLIIVTECLCELSGIGVFVFQFGEMCLRFAEQYFHKAGGVLFKYLLKRVKKRYIIISIIWQLMMVW